MTARWQEFENSSTYLQAIAKELEHEGLLQDVLAAMPPDCRPGFERPLVRRWWPGQVLGEANDIVIRLRDAATLERVVLHALRNSMGKVIGPLVKVMLSLSGSSPGSLLNNAERLMTAGVRGLRFGWTQSGPNDGEFTVYYPVPITHGFVVHYRAIMFHVLNLTQREGDVDGGVLRDGGKTVALRLHWR